MQLIQVPDEGLHLYYKKGRAGDDPARAKEKLEEKQNDVDDSVKEFAKLFEELTGNEFEPWEREKKFQKKPRKFYPVDMVFFSCLLQTHTQPHTEIAYRK